MNTVVATEDTSSPPVLLAEPRQNAVSHTRSPLIRDSFGYLASKVIPGLVGMISVPIFVRLIGIDEYGHLSVILPVLMALGGAGSGWLQQGVLRFHPASDGSPEFEPSFYRAVHRGTAYAIVVLCLALVPILAAMHYEWKIGIIAETYCLVQLIYYVYLTRLQAQLRPRSVLCTEILRSVAGFVLPVVLIFVAGEKSFSLVLLGLGLGYVFPLAANARSVWGQPALARLPGDLRSSTEVSRTLSQLWRFGWAVGVWLMLCQALPIVGRLAIQRYQGYAQAGIYASLYEVAVRSFSLFAAPVTQAAHPRIMQSWNLGNHQATRDTIRHAIRIQILMFLPVEAIGIIFARPFTRLILGAHSASSALLPLLMLGGFFWQIALLVHKPLEVMQRTTAMLSGMLAVVLIEIAGNYILVSRFGMQAAVYVFVVGALVYIGFVACMGALFRDQSPVCTFRTDP